MAGTTKPRKRYRPRPVADDPVTLALRRARKVPADQVEVTVAPITDAFRAMREGVGSEVHWAVLYGSIELARAIEHQGVIRGLHGHLTAAEAALGGIRHRAMERGTWRCTPLYWQEIEALDTFVMVHRYQLENLSEGEWRRAYERAEAMVRAAGGQVVDIRELQAEQLHLLGGANA